MSEHNTSTDAETVLPAPGPQNLPALEQPAVRRPNSPLSRAAARASTRLGVTRILLFFGLFVGLMYVTHFLITSGLRKIETSGFGVTNQIVNGQINADIVISGSSRAQTHYDPRIIEQATGLSTYNIGRNGSQTDLQLAVLKTYLQHNRKPKLIIHNLDSFSFVTSKEIYDPAQYIPYLSEAPIYAAVKKVYPDAWKWKYFPLYAYVVTDIRFAWLTGVKRWLGSTPREDHINGFTPRFTQWTGDFEHYREQNPNGVAFEIEAQGVRDLSELAALCRQKNIRLLFVYSPVFYEMQRLERNRSEIFGVFTKIAAEFDYPIIDFSESDISKNQENFYNSQHLNSKGATQFSAALAKHLEAGQILTKSAE